MEGGGVRNASSYNCWVAEFDAPSELISSKSPSRHRLFQDQPW